MVMLLDNKAPEPIYIIDGSNKTITIPAGEWTCPKGWVFKSYPIPASGGTTIASNAAPGYCFPDTDATRGSELRGSLTPICESR